MNPVLSVSVWRFVAGRIAGGAVVAIAAIVATAAHAASIALSQDAVTEAVARRLFTDNGKKMLAGSIPSCSYAYAEKPAVSFRAGRVYLRVHLAGRAGLSVNGACMGAGDAFNATMSGQPYVEGESISVRDVRMDEGKKEYRSLLEPLLRRQLPALLGSNLRADLARYLDSNVADFRMAVKEFRLQEVRADDGMLLVRFDFALHAMPR